MKASNPTPKKLTLQSMTITREGLIHVAIDTTGNHCGPADQVIRRNGQAFMPVKYSCRVICKPKTDERGFLFDQAALDKWLKKVAGEITPLSCEKLAESYAERMLEKMARDVPHCEVTWLEFTLSPAPHAASITVEYGA